MFYLRVGLRSAFLFSLVGALAACGGGGGGGGASSAPTTPSDITFPIASAYSSLIINGLQTSINISGKASNISFTGNGTVSYSSAVASTFEGQAGMSITQSITGTLVVQGSSIPLPALSNSIFYDSNYNELGSIFVDGSYSLVTSSQPLPLAAHVNDSGTINAATTYLNSSKFSVVGSTTSSYRIDADSATSVIFHITTKIYDASHILGETDDYRFRVTTAGNISFVSLDTLSGDGADKIHFAAP